MKAHFYIPKMFHPFGFSSWKSNDPKIIATRTYLFENFSQKRPPKILSELFWVKIHLKWAVIPCYPRRGRKARNFTTNVPKILDLKSSSEQIFFENWLWVPLVIRKCCFLPGDVVFPVVVSVVGSKKKKKKAQLLDAFKWSITQRRVFDLIEFLIALVTDPCLGKPLELAFREDLF